MLREAIPKKLAVATGIVVVLAGLRFAAPLVVSLLLSAFIAVGVQPVVRSLRARNVGPYLATAAASAVVVVVVGGLAFLVGFAASELSEVLPEYRNQLTALQADTVGWLRAHGLHSVAPAVDKLSLRGPIRTYLAEGLVDAASSLGRISFVVLVAIFTVLESTTLERKVSHVTGGSEETLHRLSRVLRRVERYLVIKTATSLLTGVLIGVWTASLGLTAPFLWGALAFALNFVPVIGSVMAGIPATVIAVVEQGWPTAALLASGYVAVNAFIGLVLEPRVMGRAMGLSPLVVLLALAFWGWVLGPFGALLSVPLTKMLEIALADSPRFAWIAVLLGQPPTSEPRDEGPRTEAGAQRAA